MMWQAYAACRGADPKLFDRFAESTRVTPETVADATEVAEAWCSGCPVIARCAKFGDDARHEGLYGGSLRTGPPDKYKRRPLIKGVPLLPLSGRRTGVSNGWGAA